MSGEMFTTKDTKSTKIWMTEGLVVGLVLERMRLEVNSRKAGEGIALCIGSALPHRR